MTREEATLAATQLAESIEKDVRSVHGPVVWQTGNNYFPPIRSFPVAEDVYQADVRGALWEVFTEALERELNNRDILLECPDYDNALYGVDLRRWRRTEWVSGAVDDLNDEWELIT